MRHIRRAAVTGLFALWLAPLNAETQAQPPETQVESRLAAEAPQQGREEKE